MIVPIHTDDLLVLTHWAGMTISSVPTVNFIRVKFTQSLEMIALLQEERLRSRELLCKLGC